MAKAPAFQFYAKEWLSSPRVMLMTPEQEGAYIRLLAYCWDSGDCSLPDNDDALATLSRIGKRWGRGVGLAVRDCFIQHPNKAGFLTNDRLLQEHRKQEEWRRKCSRGGKGSSTTLQVPLSISSDLLASKSQERGDIAFASASASASADSPLHPPEAGEGVAPLSEKQSLIAALCEVCRERPGPKADAAADSLLELDPPLTTDELRRFEREYHRHCNYSSARRREYPTLGECEKYAHRVRKAAKPPAPAKPVVSTAADAEREAERLKAREPLDRYWHALSKPEQDAIDAEAIDLLVRRGDYKRAAFDAPSVEWGPMQATAYQAMLDKIVRERMAGGPA